MSKRTASELAWAGRSLEFRLALLERFRERLVAERESLLTLLKELRPGCSRAELISSEIIPLLDNIAFLNQRASKILQPVKLGRRGQPVWLWGVESVVYRESLGRVVIVAPGNYPLFLPLVQAVYGWAVGNCIWLKSAPGSFPLHDRVRNLFLSVGGPAEAFRLLGEENSSYPWALSEGVDKVILVGSASTGEAVLSQAGKALVPTVAELSGWDAVFIHPEADMAQAAAAVAFGLALNGGRTCVAPRRIFFRGDVERLESLLENSLQERGRVALSEAEKLCVEEARSSGCRVLGAPDGPVVLSRVRRDHRLLREASFGALAVLHVVESDEEALELSRHCRHALGATLFGPLEWAETLSHQVPGQMVCINDMIVPSADPRLPFGGTGRSGFGHMRGKEGLLEMTAVRVISTRRGGTTDHLRPPSAVDDPLLERFLLMAHGSGVGQKFRATVEMIALIARERIRRRMARRRAERGESGS